MALSPVTAVAAVGAVAAALLAPHMTPDPPQADRMASMPVVQLDGRVLHPETREGIPDAGVFFEGAADTVRTDSAGNFVLAAVPDQALVIEHPEHRGLRFPAEHLPTRGEILAIPHLREAGRFRQASPLLFVVGPGSLVSATVSSSEDTWCGFDSAQSEGASAAIEGIRINRAPSAEAEFGATAISGVILITCKPGV